MGLLKPLLFANATAVVAVTCLPAAKYRVSIRRSLLSRRRSHLARSSLVGGIQCKVVVSWSSSLGRLGCSKSIGDQKVVRAVIDRGWGKMCWAFFADRPCSLKKRDGHYFSLKSRVEQVDSRHFTGFREGIRRTMTNQELLYVIRL